LQLAANNPTLSLSGLCRILSCRRNIRVSRSTVWRAIKRNQKMLVASTQQKVSPAKVDWHNQPATSQSEPGSSVAHELETRTMSVRA